MSGKRAYDDGGKYLTVKIRKLEVAKPVEQRFTALANPLDMINRTDDDKKDPAKIIIPIEDFVASCWATINGGYPVSVFGEKHPELPDRVVTANSIQMLKFIGMSTAMMAVKELDMKNATYLSNRWKAYLAGINKTDLVDMSKALQILRDYQGIINTRDGMEDKIIGETLYTIIKGTAEDKDLYKQIEMVYKGAGMKSVELMQEFINTGTSKALIMNTVLDQAEKFTVEYTNFKNKQGSLSQFGRILGLPGIPINRDYPDLYLAAGTWAKHLGKIGKTGNFKITDVQTRGNAADIEKKAVQEIRQAVGAEIVTDRTIERLSALGITLILQKVPEGVNPTTLSVNDVYRE